MKELRRPTKEEFKKLKELVEFNSYEQKYFDGMKKKRDSKFDKKDYGSKIEFYVKELKSIKNRFGKRVAVERRLKYLIAHAYEWLGTYGLEGHDSLERAKMFEKAVVWYQKADEVTGFFTDYAIRQSEACAGAAHFRRQSGLEGEVTEWFAQRDKQLSKAVLGENVIMVNDNLMIEYLKKIANEKVEGVADLYISKIDPNSN